ncbi:hypothetical protein H0H92_001273 [Tricholoma furcatifolium]|nr:hypothetical protein H0H92_001273 [Tricholoma furcatifolium]
MNLGGISSTIPRSILISDARAQRLERSRTRSTQRRLREAFEMDPHGIQGLSASVLLGQTDDGAVRAWSEIVDNGERVGHDLFRIPRKHSEMKGIWMDWICQMAWLLLRAVSKDPLRAISQRNVLNTLLSQSIAGLDVSGQVLQYICAKDYGLLARSISSIAPSADESLALPSIIDLAILLLSTSSPAALFPVFLNILTIPHLPDRLPNASFTLLSSKIPFLLVGQTLDPGRVIEETTVDQRVYLIANLPVFVKPGYKLLESGLLVAYLSLLEKLVKAVPQDILNPPVEHVRQAFGAYSDPYDSDAADDVEDSLAASAVAPVTSPVLSFGHVQIDLRTYKRVLMLPSAKHVSSLVRLPLSSSDLTRFLTTLCVVWPGVKDIFLEIVLKQQQDLASPRSSVPDDIPFDLRAGMFRSFIRVHGSQDSSDTPTQTVRVARGNVAQDAFNELNGVDLKNPVKIVFVNRFGMQEKGSDAGGLFREFLKELSKEVFHANRGLWLETSMNELYPNPHATEAPNLLWYRFIGCIVGKAMYEAILLDLTFAEFFLSKWLGSQNSCNVDDLASLDDEFYRGFVTLQDDKRGPVENLHLNFTITVKELGETKTIDLIPGGGEVSVTEENRVDYIQKVVDYKLNEQFIKQSRAFFEGIGTMIEPRLIRMFHRQEIQTLISGPNKPIDLDDLRRHTTYTNSYHDKEETIVMFWNVVNTFDEQQRKALLTFFTSCGRPPLFGFQELNPKFSITANLDERCLPTATSEI